MKNESKSWQPAVFLFFKISGWIAFPVVISLVVGKWLDRRFETEPIFFLSLTAIAFGISLYGIVRESKKTMKDLEDKGKVEDTK